MGDATAPPVTSNLFARGRTELHLAHTLHSSRIYEHSGVFSNHQAADSLLVLGSSVSVPNKTWFTSRSSRLIAPTKAVALGSSSWCTPAWHRTAD